jgi:hypothetical protein
MTQARAPLEEFPQDLKLKHVTGTAVLRHWDVRH